MRRAASFAATRGRVLRARSTAPGARSPRRSRQCSRTASSSLTRCAKRRTTRGTRWTRRTVPAWGSSFPTACSGRAKTTTRRTRPRRRPVRSMRGTATDNPSLELRRSRAQRLRGLYAVTPDLDDTAELAARVAAAVAMGADYVAFGSFFASSVKPGARKASVELLSRARTLGVPVVAIGGIDADNAAELVRAGADALAVISAVFGEPTLDDVEIAARTLARLFVPPSAAPRVD